MFELVLSVCMISEPNLCKDVHLTYVGQVSPFQCMMRGQPEIAKWSVSHPNWTIKRWHCGNVDFAKKEI